MSWHRSRPCPRRESLSVTPPAGEQVPGRVPEKAAGGSDSGAVGAGENAAGCRPGAAQPRYGGMPTGFEIPPSRRRLTTATSLLVAAGVLAACGSSTSGTFTAGAAHCASGRGAVGYIPKLGTDPYMTTVRDAATAAAAKIGGSVIYTSPNDASGPAQIPFVNQLVAQKVCVIAIAGNDLNSTAAALAAARAAGIKVLSWDSDIAASRRAVFISQAQNDELGEKMLDSMRQMLGPDGGDFAILSSTPTAVEQNARIASMKQRLATDPSLKNLRLVTVAYNQELADVDTQPTKALIDAYPDLEGILVLAGVDLPAAAQALSQMGVLGEVKLTGLAPVSQIKNYIKAGTVQDVWWNVPDLGTLSYYAAQALATGKITGAAGETFEAGDLGTFTIGDNGVVVLGPAQIVTPQNVDSFPF
jgi:rhamnose transport system substrate-binding protein